MKLNRSMFEGGLGLPIMAIGWSVIISVAGCWAWLETANFWACLSVWVPMWFGGAAPAEMPELADGYVGSFLMAGFALLAQWTANFVILRVRNGHSRLLWAAYAICALVAAVSLHHVYEAQQAPHWRAQVEARAELRAEDESIIRDNRAFLRRVQERTMSLNTDTVARRNESVSTPMLQEAERAERAIADANARLARIPVLSEQRPFDAGDWVAIALAVMLATLEFALYWGMGGAPNGHLNPAKSGTGAGAKASDDPVQGVNSGVDPATLQDKAPAPVILVPEKVFVGELVFDSKAGATGLLNEMLKAGVVNEFDLRSKVNSISANRRYGNIKQAPEMKRAS